MTDSVKETRQQKEHRGLTLETTSGRGDVGQNLKKRGEREYRWSFQKVGRLGTLYQLWYKYHKIYVNIYIYKITQLSMYYLYDMAT